MKTHASLVSYVLVAVLLLSGMVIPNIGPFDADVVSAATGSTNTPATPTTTTPQAPTVTPTTNDITHTLKLGAKGHEVKLLQLWLNENGYKLKVDGVFGKATLAAVKDYQKKNGFKVDGIVGPQLVAKLNPAMAKTTIKMGRAEYAAHGTKCFTVAVVAMAGDKIVAASIDDYQFLGRDVAFGVPNSDKDFGTNYKDPAKVLASKRANAEYYSELMKEEAKATQSLDTSYDAIQAYVVGKTIAELEATLKNTTKEKMVDTVSGATLVDTYGYTAAIVAAAKNAKENSSLQVEAAQLKNIKMVRTEYAAHGTKCFTVPVALMLGDKILAASIDDYQFLGKDVAKGVPNSDKDFGTNYKDPAKVLASKRANAEYYSELMKEEAKATQSLDTSYNAIQAYVAGKTVGELKAILGKNNKAQMVDAVSGSTLVDTYGYISSIVAAAEGAREHKVALKIGRAEYAAHGTRCFTVAVVAMAGDKIAAASIDDYQFLSTDVTKPVPNSDKDLGKNYKDPKMAIASKRANVEYYSELMKEEAKSTKALDKSYDAIQAYVKGKTIAELEATLKNTTKEKMVDAVSGATLVDTYGYTAAIVEAAKAAAKAPYSPYSIDIASLGALKIGRTEFAAHGTRCFTVPVVVMAGDKIVAASIDDYQFLSTDVTKPVPNSDKDFGANYKDPKMALASKRANAEYYSELMKEEAKATQSLDKSYDAIQAYAAGKTIAELEATLTSTPKDKMVDAVSGSTLADTYGYTAAIVAAAKLAQ